MKEMVGGCCVCADDRGFEENPLVYCDGPDCDVAVHQGCYGILKVPEDSWYCAKCSNRNDRIDKEAQCELCVTPDGALKRTSNGGWVHVICALYIPEVKFGDVHSMEPVLLSEIPADRFNKSCYICETKGNMEAATRGACMHCNRSGCKKHFHVTCAQHKGLLCEEGGVSKNVKYCGYCSHHLRKMKDEPGVKTIPAFRPVKRNGTGSRSGSGTSTPDSRYKRNGPTTTPLLSDKGTNSPANNDSRKNCVDATKLPPTAVVGSNNGHSNGPTTGGEPPLVNNSVIVSCSVSTSSVGTTSMASTTTALPSSVALSAPSPVLAFTPASYSSAGPMEVSMEVIKTEPSRVPNAFSGKENPLLPQPQPQPSPLPIAKRPRGISASGEDKPKRPRKSSKKTVKSLLESVSHVVDETVSSFQAERVANQQQAQRESQQQAALQLQQQQQQQHQQQQQLQQNASAFAAGINSAAAALLQVPCGSSETALPAFATLAGDAFLSQNSTSGVPLKPIPRLGLADGTNSQNLPSSLEQLLERQWERGSQFLTDQAQHFDIASLLTCLHQLKAENQRLEKDIMAWSSRRDHLLAVNARLSIAYGQNHQSPHSPRPHPPPSTLPQDFSTESSPSSSLSHLRSMATTISPVTQGSHIKSAQTQASTPGLSPSTRTLTGGVAGQSPLGFSTLGSGSGVFTSVSRQSGKESCGTSPDRTNSSTFLIPRAPTPLLPPGPSPSMAALGTHQYTTGLTQEQQYMLLQHQQAAAAAAYNLAAAGMVPSTSPHRSGSVGSMVGGGGGVGK